MLQALDLPLNLGGFDFLGVDLRRVFEQPQNVVFQASQTTHVYEVGLEA